MIFGIALIVIGLAFLLQNLGFLPANAWNVIWPILVIAIGAGFLLKKGRHCWCCGQEHKESQ